MNMVLHQDDENMIEMANLLGIVAFLSQQARCERSKRAKNYKDSFHGDLLSLVDKKQIEPWE
jgi:hypothetical protein